MLAGTALAAPLILPGLQLAKGSNRTVVGPSLLPKGLPPKEVVHLIFQGFDGLPVLHSQWFGLSTYEATCVYVGVIVLVLAATALVLRWRRPEVRALALVAVVMGLLVFVPPLVSVLDSSVARIYWTFAMTPMVLAVAVLSGIGMDIVVKSHKEPRVRRALAIGFGAWRWCSGSSGLWPDGDLLHRRSPSARTTPFGPPSRCLPGWSLCGRCRNCPRAARTGKVSSAVGAGTVAGSLLLLVETAFLLASGAPLLSSSSHYPTSTPEVTALKRTVGTAIVGFGGTPTFSLKAGIVTNANLLYGVQEFAAYDPMTPHAYFSLDKLDKSGSPCRPSTRTY